MKKVLQGLELLLILCFLLLGGFVLYAAIMFSINFGRINDWRLISLTIMAGTLLIINAALMTINFFGNHLNRVIQIINGVIFIIAVLGLLLFGSHLALQWFAEIGLVLYSVLIINFRRN